MVWQPYWIERKSFLKHPFSLTALSIDVKLHNYDLVLMGNIYFKLQPDWTHGLAARIIYFFESGFFFLIFFFEHGLLG